MFSIQLWYIIKDTNVPNTIQYVFLATGIT
jgi:hypothetical protein